MCKFGYNQKHNTKMELFVNKEKEDLTGKFVELIGDEGSWWIVTSDNGNRVEVTVVNTKLSLPPSEITNKKFILKIVEKML